MSPKVWNDPFEHSSDEELPTPIHEGKVGTGGPGRGPDASGAKAGALANQTPPSAPNPPKS